MKSTREDKLKYVMSNALKEINFKSVMILSEDHLAEFNMQIGQKGAYRDPDVHDTSDLSIVYLIYHPREIVSFEDQMSIVNRIYFWTQHFFYSNPKNVFLRTYSKMNIQLQEQE